MYLDPWEWFVTAHDVRYASEQGVKRILYHESGTYVWTPPPAAMSVALEQLREARVKRQDSIHILIIPKLFFSNWQRQLFKACDFITFIPPKFPFWTNNCHESLILALCLPYARYKP